MATETPQVKQTYDDFLLFPDDGRRHELIDGAHHVTPAPSLEHQEVSIRLATRLQAWVERHRSGRVFAAPCDVVLSSFDVVEPDLLFVRSERLAILTAANIRGAPDLVVEILSPSSRSRDLELKRELYERFRVAEYWIVDPESRSIRQLRLEADSYTWSRELRAPGDRLTTPLLPGLELAPVEIFPRKLT